MKEESHCSTIDLDLNFARRFKINVEYTGFERMKSESRGKDHLSLNIVGCRYRFANEELY